VGIVRDGNDGNGTWQAGLELFSKIVKENLRKEAGRIKKERKKDKPRCRNLTGTAKNGAET